MRSNRRLAALAIVVASLGGAAPADAGSQSSKPTQVMPGSFGYSGNEQGGTAFASGSIESVKRCQADRTVKIYGFIDERKRLIDVDRSSRNGSWSGRGLVPRFPDAFQIVAERAQRGKLTCREDSVTTGTNG